MRYAYPSRARPALAAHAGRAGDARFGQATASVVTLDVTDQQRSQRRSEQLLREMTTILESTTAGIAYLRGGTLVRCNRRFETMLRLPPSASPARAWPSCCRAIPMPSIAAEIREALIADAIYETEFAFDGVDAARVERRPRRRHGALAPAALVFALGAPRRRRVGVDEAIAVLSDVTRLKRSRPSSRRSRASAS